MSLIRSFTTRRSKDDWSTGTPAYVGRAAGQRQGKPILRQQISSPVALVSTTNMLSYNAPDIPGAPPVEYKTSSSTSSATSSHSSAEDSDASSGSIHSNETITDASSVGESPIRVEPEPNHLSCYFKPAVETSTNTPTRSPSFSARPSFDAPHVPSRAPSHSKKAHEVLSRKRSVQRTKSPPPTARSMEITSPARSAFVESPRENPFGNELAQLDEVAEEFGHVVRDAQADSDIVYLKTRGLASFGASDYMNEIQSLLSDYIYANEQAVQDFGGWI